MAKDTDKLGRYWAKRDFGRTPEPAGAPTGQDGEDGRPRFVVQRHRARRLHYDLRFEIDGVLVSWAVPNGPTLDPAVKRLAVHVEDHPIEYLDFEGVIPAGEYGGGDVIVWDLGTWEPHATDDPAAAVAAGELHVDVTGHKLHGRLILVRSGGRGRRGGARGDSGHSGGDSEQWLLLHKDDEAAVKGWNPEDHPRSVLSGRTNDEVRADPDRLWRSDLPPAEASIELRPPTIPGPSQDDLDALEELGSSGRWDVFGRSLRLTNLDKELFPGRPGAPDGVTKRELIGYAARIAPVILPYLAGRPLNMHRFPGGVGVPGFWHKQLPGPRARLGASLGQPRGRAREDNYLPGRRRASGARLGRELRGARVARLDRHDRQPAQPELRADRHRPGVVDDLGGDSRTGQAAQDGARAPRRAGAAEGHRAARNPDLDPGDGRPELRGHTRLGRAAVEDNRICRA